MLTSEEWHKAKNNIHIKMEKDIWRYSVKKSSIFRVLSIVFFGITLLLYITAKSSISTSLFFAAAAFVMNFIAHFTYNKEQKQKREEKRLEIVRQKQIEQDKQEKEALELKRQAQAKREQEDKSEDWVCPKCAFLNPGKNKYCQHCGNKKP